MSAGVATVAGRRFDLSAGRSLAIALDFEGAQPSFFGAPRARREAVAAGDFLGDTRRGGSCNCERLELVPHCNGTHTECVAHLTDARGAVHELIGAVTAPAGLVSVAPERLSGTGESGPNSARPDDRVLPRRALAEAADAIGGLASTTALILRTLDGGPDKRTRDWMAGEPPAWLTREAAAWLVEQNIEHILIELPSLDRADSGGELLAHQLFWGLPEGSRDLREARRPHASVTEMIAVPDDVSDGVWLLRLEVPPLNTDAVPSRPIIYPDMASSSGGGRANAHHGELSP